MAKSNTLLKRTTNALLDLIAEAAPNTALPSESELSRTLGVSRTTVRGALHQLEERAIVARTGNQVTLARRPGEQDHFADAQTVTTQERIEQMLMERMLRGGWAPGHEFSESDLARACGVSTASVREFLISFSRYQLIEKRSRSGWRLLGLDVQFANEVADMRALIELSAIQQIFPAGEPRWVDRIDGFLDRHYDLQTSIDSKYLDFPALDREFHSFLITHMRNRFASKFVDVIAFTFHYHYKWNSDDQKLRVMASLGDHIGILEALRMNNMILAKERLAAHLAASRSSLIQSLKENDVQRAELRLEPSGAAG
ncbi:GntR family transcriptional regulator [Azospirillum sp. YIM B02556]|uniref:GntR family transcriptional regulator n=1 Tax=Azospirillum endophyticum TaxID=2800326 RepID=A0ABS1FBU7_9PROT|nr:GntR family transcriptional regulator [Azospirillum endophyticum]MBK1840867.1 GntR family transcriptional regulator [Azospirillum endophyticum]